MYTHSPTLQWKHCYLLYCLHTAPILSTVNSLVLSFEVFAFFVRRRALSIPLCLQALAAITASAQTVFLTARAVGALIRRLVWVACKTARTQALARTGTSPHAHHVSARYPLAPVASVWSFFAADCPVGSFGSTRLPWCVYSVFVSCLIMVCCLQPAVRGRQLRQPGWPHSANLQRPVLRRLLVSSLCRFSLFFHRVSFACLQVRGRLHNTNAIRLPSADHQQPWRQL